MNLNVKYTHTEEVHNMKDPNIIVPLVMEIIMPKSVVDIGCGIGNFLKVFKENGVVDILGIDGSWVNRELLAKNISLTEFIEHDLENNIKLNKYYDLVVNLEVAEHLSINSAELHVKNLINAGKIILFSAAIPNQPGQNHINEQWLSYWEKLFFKHDYVLHNIMRPILWNTKCQTCYKQNMVVFTPKDYLFGHEIKYSILKDVVHKELYEFKIDQLEQINNEYKKMLNGTISFKTVCKMILKRTFGLKFWNKIKSTLD